MRKLRFKGNGASGPTGILSDSFGVLVTEFMHDTFQGNTEGSVVEKGGTGFVGNWISGDKASQLIAYDRVNDYPDGEAVQGLADGEGFSDSWQTYTSP